MIYYITPGGIVFHAASAHMAEESETDRIADAQTPISTEEIMATIERVSAEIERLDYVPATGQHRSDTDRV